MRVWRAEDGVVLQTLVGHTRSVAGIAWSPDGRQFASCGGGGATGEVFLWDAESGEQLGSFTGHASLVFRVAWSMDGKMLFSGGVTGNIRWWDVASRVCRYTRQGHQGWIRALSTRRDYATLVSAGEDSIIQLWDIQRAEPIRTLRATRPYERLNITGISGLTEAQKASLQALGAADSISDGRLASGERAPSSDARSPPAEEQSPTQADREVAIGLPFQSTAFIGRGPEVTQIASILADPQCRLLTLLGPGGIGKTRLALAVAAAQTTAFTHGIAFVALAAVSTPNQIVSAIGDTLSLSFAGHADPTTHLLSYLRARHMLLLLDNFEHLLAGADLVSDILERAPGASILITSRERLNLQAEWLFDVTGLAYPPEDPHWSATPQHLAALTDYSAIQLFVQRATQVQPGLTLDEVTLTTIGRICRHVAGMPLAIELAAASVRTLSLAAIEWQIRSNMDVLASSRRDVPVRHRSMRAVFEHSWRLLSEGERALFSYLAVFRGGWTAEAAKQVAKATLVALTALIDRSLVRSGSAGPREFGARAELNGAAEPRFDMLEPLREYALEQLMARGEAEALQRAHATYYLARAEAVAAQWGTPTVDSAIAQLDREHDNMRAVLRWASDNGEGMVGLRLAQALWQFWRSYGYASEGRVWLEQLLRLVDNPTDMAAMAARQRGLHAAAWLASDQHDFADAARLFEQSAALRRALGETEVETDLLLNQARQARVQGQYQRATVLIEDALARDRARGDRGSLSTGGLGQSLLEMALVVREQGDFARAADLYKDCVELHRALGDRERMSMALLGLGDIARDLGDVRKIRTYSEQSLELFRELGIQWAIGFALNNLALAAYREGDLEQALARAKESVALFRSGQADGSLAEVLITLGQIMRAQGDATAALGALTEALRFAWAVGPRVMLAAALEGLADLGATPAQAEPAVRLLAGAAALREQMGTPVRPADRPAVEHSLALARSALGADAFAVIWAEAQALPLEQLLRTIPIAAPLDALGDRVGR